MKSVLGGLQKILFLAACGFAVTMGVAAAGALVWWIHFEVWGISGTASDTTFQAVAEQMK